MLILSVILYSPTLRRSVILAQEFHSQCHNSIFRGTFSAYRRLLSQILLLSDFPRLKGLFCMSQSGLNFRSHYSRVPGDAEKNCSFSTFPRE